LLWVSKVNRSSLHRLLQRQDGLVHADMPVTPESSVPSAEHRSRPQVGHVKRADMPVIQESSVRSAVNLSRRQDGHALVDMQAIPVIFAQNAEHQNLHKF